MSLFLDFDGTITTKDTISALVNACIEHQRTANALDLSRAWAHILEEYDTDYRSYLQDYPQPESERDTLAKESHFLRSLRDVEMRSVARVSASGLFRGLDDFWFFEAGKRAVASGAVQIRPGFGELVDCSAGNSWAITVISVNWSAAFIKGVLAAELAAHNSPDITIISNEVVAGGGVAGPLLPYQTDREVVLCTSSDKLRITKFLAGSRQTQKYPTQALGVYFGDSNTDLECLLEWPGSVVLADNGDTKVLQTLKRLNHDVRHVENSQSLSCTQPLVWARNFKEVLASDSFTDRLGKVHQPA